MAFKNAPIILACPHERKKTTKCLTFRNFRSSLYINSPTGRVERRFYILCSTTDARNPAPVQVGSLSHYVQVFNLPKTKIAPENRPSQKETGIPTINFQMLFVSLMEGKHPTCRTLSYQHYDYWNESLPKGCQEKMFKVTP